ncbi:hypothetical protein CHEID_00660 [Corynebacterium heidelbergense]|nr:hypothetical protein CHEID_00660 [Corynebacterium heidelbergense]
MPVAATCTARDAAGLSRPIGYGSGSSIVVTSDLPNNAFTLTGLGKDDRVECVVQNKAQVANFALSKKPYPPAQPRIVGKQNGQRLNSEYLVEVTNPSTTAGAPTELRELPSTPPGFTVDSVTVVPDGPTPLVTSAQEMTRSNNTWTLGAPALQPVPAGQTSRAKVVVVYRVTDPTVVNDQALTCSGSDATKGFYNNAQLAFGSNKTSDSAACVSGLTVGFSVTKKIAGTDANTKDQAAAILEGAGTFPITYEIKNTGKAPVTSVRLNDQRLNISTGQPGAALPITGLTCNAANRMTAITDGVEVTPQTPLATGQTLICQWNAPASLMPNYGDYHADRIQVTSQYAPPAGQVAASQDPPIALQAVDPAWAVRIPVAVGTLPKSGGRGATGYLLLGLAVVGIGAISLTRTHRTT